MMGGYEPEVSLAVRIPKSDETVGLVEDNSETEKENNTDIDTVLMSYGFEYIDATGDVPLRRTRDDGNELPSTDGNYSTLAVPLNLFCSTSDIPHLPRVLDALSTIMWPSMKSVHKGSVGGGLDSKSKRERDSILEELLAHGHGTVPSPASHRDSEEEDLMEQMQELLQDVGQKAKGSSDTSHLPNFGESGVRTVSTEGSFTTKTLHPQLPRLGLNTGKTEVSIFSPTPLSLSPKDMEATSPFGGAAKPTGKFSIGFEDDFTVFVSAPALNYHEGETTPDAMSHHKQQNSETFESPMPSAIASSTLEPGSARVRYQSLGSASDFGGSDFGDEEPVYQSLGGGDDDNDDDDDLPTKEEIWETSAKLFGTAQKKGGGATVPEAGPSPGLTHEDSDGDDMKPYDLSQVMSALQQFKTDISGMDNEEERRKAAAKVALGLVYGLD